MTTDGIRYRALGREPFKALLEVHRINSTGSSLPVTPDEHGLICLRCESVTPIAPCPNCGEHHHILGFSDGQAGLFCSACQRGFTTHRCTCGTKNPVSGLTLAEVDNGSGDGSGCGCLLAVGLGVLVLLSAAALLSG
ncbi:MAG: hypothetical protein H6739_10445 [Alphaproteobacteria bacterium]|nr:hypothetical protein [Alphaproteobacteria bacterium]